MRSFKVAAIAASTALVFVGPSHAKGKWVTRIATDGRQVQVQLDGKYSECMRDVSTLWAPDPSDSATSEI